MDRVSSGVPMLKAKDLMNTTMASIVLSNSVDTMLILGEMERIRDFKRIHYPDWLMERQMHFEHRVGRRMRYGRIMEI